MCMGCSAILRYGDGLALSMLRLDEVGDMSLQNHLNLATAVVGWELKSGQISPSRKLLGITVWKEPS